MTESTGIVGAGAFGTALACVLGSAGHPVKLWGRDQKAVSEINEKRTNAKYLPECRIPPAVEATSDLGDLDGVSHLLMALPAPALAGFLSRNGIPANGVPVVLCAKGIDPDGFRLQSETLAEFAPDLTAAVLTGPGFASELALGRPAAMTLACQNPLVGPRLQRDLSTSTLRLYLTRDVTGAQLGGAMKNVIAIACGMAIGSDLGESARAALMTRGWSEILRLGLALGSNEKTLAGLSGFGDLVLTCTSDRSRNYAFGLALGMGVEPAKGVTVEGVRTARAVCGLAREHGIDTPVTDAIVQVLDGEGSISDALQALMSRPLRNE